MSFYHQIRILDYTVDINIKVPVYNITEQDILVTNFFYFVSDFQACWSDMKAVNS